MEAGPGCVHGEQTNRLAVSTLAVSASETRFPLPFFASPRAHPDELPLSSGSFLGYEEMTKEEDRDASGHKLKFTT